MDTLYAQQGDTLELICWRYYGHTQGTVEAVLIANPGLADKGAILPMGTAIKMPIQTTQAATTTINLWD